MRKIMMCAAFIAAIGLFTTTNAQEPQKECTKSEQCCQKKCDNDKKCDKACCKDCKNVDCQKAECKQCTCDKAKCKSACKQACDSKKK